MRKKNKCPGKDFLHVPIAKCQKEPGHKGLCQNGYISFIPTNVGSPEWKNGKPDS